MDRHVKDLARPTPSTHSSSSSSSGPFFSKLFGRRDLASTRSSTSTEVPRVSRQANVALPGSEARAVSQDTAQRDLRDGTAWTEERWQTFDLEEALQILHTAKDQPLVGGDTQLLDTLRTVSQYVAREGEAPALSTIEQLYTIVESYVDYPATKKELPVRIESYKLLTILLRVAPPSSSLLDRLGTPKQTTDGQLHPTNVTARSIYHSIVDPGSSSDLTSWLLLLARLAALKVLTKDGADVEGLDGLVAWAVKTTQTVGKEWTAWCGLAEDVEPGIEPTSPSAQALAVLIDYLTAIITNHLPLFGSSDLTTISKPLLCLLWSGANAERVLNPEPASSLSPTNSVGSAPGSRVGSGFTSPIGVTNSLGLDSPVKRVGSIRTRREPIKSQSPQGSRTPRGSITSSMLMSPPQLPQRGPSPVPALPHTPKWMSLVESLTALFEMLLTKSHLSPTMLAPILHTMALILGQAPPEDIDSPGPVFTGVEAVIFLIVGKRGGRTGEKALKSVLEKPLEFDATHLQEGWEAVVVRGAVVACRMLLRRTSQMDLNSASPVGLITLPSLLPSLVACLSTNRFPTTETGYASKRDQWEQVDAEVLYLLEDHLTRLENGPGGEGAALAGDAWVEGEAVCDLLEGVIDRAKAFKHVDGSLYAFQTATDLAAGDGGELPNSLATFSSILLRLPSALARLHASASSQPSFVHPRYIEMLLNLSRHLPDATAISVIDYYDREGLCLPFTIGWIDNIWKLLHAFYIGSGTAKPATAVRVRAAELLYGSVYKYAREMPEHRAEVVDRAILPLLEQTISDEQIASVETSAWDVLTTAAVSETIERDEKRRRAIALKQEAEAELDDDTPELSPAIKEAVVGGNFDRIRDLLKMVAVSSSCVHDHTPSAVSLLASFGMAQGFAESLTSESDRGSSSSKDRRTESSAASLMGLVGGFSPTYKAKELPPISTRTMAAGPGSHSITSPETTEDNSSETKGAPVPSPPIASPSHTDCKSLQAIQALIAIFTRLSFAPPHSLTSSSKTARTPASSRCMLLYKDLLNLLYPMADVSPQHLAPEDRSASVRVHAQCPRARLVVLQWLLRLRADRKHRIFVASGVGTAALPTAAIISRTHETHDAAVAQVSADEARKRPKNWPAAGPDASEERGRDRSSRESSHRSRSRSRPAAQMVQAPQAVRSTAPYKPLWCLPEKLSFERPPDDQPSEGMTTYSPRHPILQHIEPPKDDVWLPVSDYVRVLIGLLSFETDWELISYILVFLPSQLLNKHFWCGERAHKELNALMRLICDGIINDRLAKNVTLPPFVKKTDVHAVAYQTLTMMLGYHNFFYTKSDSDDLIQALDKGLGRNSLTAKPCVHALTIATYEIESSVAKHLPSILGKLSQIMSNVAVSVHILEFLSAVGQTPSLYGNFTEEHYRLVFAVAVTYIQEHNARTDVPFDPTGSKEAFTLSQHVITLAYYVIYLWFMAVRLPQRAKHVAYITRGLIHANSGKQTVDEMAEVCFDWMARYTYGNADPKPASSFLNDLIMRPGDADRPSAQEKKARSWILGGAIVTITAQARAGWATITTTRPSGTTSMLCKLENVPLLALGEDNADLVSLPAMLMGDRDPEMMARPTLRAPPLPGSSSDTEESEEPPADPFKPVNIAMSSSPQAVTSPLDTESPFGFVWSGATPSQRRKDVSVDPSYLGLQISAYPYASITSPRGRLIPQDEKFERGLRGIENIAVIDTHKIAVLYAGPGQTTEAEILGNNDGSPWFLRFLSGLGRLIKLKGQKDIFVGGLDRENDEDGEYAYAWWDDLGQMIFHAPILMPKRPDDPTSQRKKRLVGNDFVTIVYNNSGQDYQFDTIKTHFQFVNIVISSHTSGFAHAGEVRGDEQGHIGMDFFKVTVQRAPGIPEFSPIGEYKLVSAKALPLVVRQIAFHANILAQRFVHIREAQTAQQAEYISNWRARLRAIARIRENMPAPVMPEPGDLVQEQEFLRDFTRNFSERGPNGPKDL